MGEAERPDWVMTMVSVIHIWAVTGATRTV